MTISTILVALVTSVFLAQNSFYASVAERSEVQDNLRSVTELIASEARGVAPGGVLVADSTRFAFRVPIRVAAVCEPSGGADVRVRIPERTSMDTSEVSGYAIHDASGDWDFRASTWSALLKDTAIRNAQDCAANGADTAGIASDFVDLNMMDPLGLGDVIMIYREVELSIAASGLDPSTQALYRGVYGSTLVEFASGLNGITHFRYRLGTPTYQTSVALSDLSLVDGVRVVAVSESSRTATGGYTYGWSVDIPLRNSR